MPLLDHLLVELARAGRFDLSLEIEPDEPVAEVDAAGAALGRRSTPCSRPGAHGRGVMLCGRGARDGRPRGSGTPLVASNADLTRRGWARDRPRRALPARARRGGGLTLHVRLIEGEDTDHVLEAIFKALGVALSEAAASRPTIGETAWRRP